MPLNLTHCTSKHSQTKQHEMALYIAKNWSTASIYLFLKCWRNLKTVSYWMWNLGKKASNQNLESEGVLPAVGEPEKERLLSDDTFLLRENELDGVICPNKVALLTCLMCTRPRVRGTSRCCLLFTSARYSVRPPHHGPQRRASCGPAWSKQRDKEDSVKERRGTPHLSCRHFSYSEVLSVFPLHRPEFTFMWWWKWLIPQRLP